MRTIMAKAAKILVLAMLVLVCVNVLSMRTAEATIIVHQPETGLRVPVYGNGSPLIRIAIEPEQEYHETVLNGESITAPYYLCILITCNEKRLYYVRFAYSTTRMIEFDLPVTDIGNYKLEMMNDYPIKETTPTGDRVYYSYPRPDNFKQAKPEATVTFVSYHAEHIPSVNYTVDRHPTCTRKGSQSLHCQRCDAIIEGTEQEIPATGHDWKVSYSWSDDCTSVTARAVCRNDKSHKHTETVKASLKMETLPTESARGRGTWSASFKNSLFSGQKKTIDMLQKVSRLQAAAVTKRKIEVSWNRLPTIYRKLAKKVEIQVSTDKNFRKNVHRRLVSSVKKTAMIPNLKPGKLYYVRIRTYTKDGNSTYFSQWTNVESVWTRSR